MAVLLVYLKSQQSFEVLRSDWSLAMFVSDHADNHKIELHQTITIPFDSIVCFRVFRVSCCNAF